MVKKIYKCCICHETLEEKPIRLVKQLYGYYGYNQYGDVKRYDFCKKCYARFNGWIKKYEEKNEIGGF